MIKCQDCGRDNLTTTRFCAGCGAQLRIDLPVHDPARVLKRMRKAFARRGARERAQVRGEAQQLASASRHLDLVLIVMAALTAVAAWWGLSTAVVALNRPPPVIAVAPLPVPAPLPANTTAADPAPVANANAEPLGPRFVGRAADRRPALEPGGAGGADQAGRETRGGGDGGISRRAVLNRDRGAAPARVASIEATPPVERAVEAPPPEPPPVAVAPRDRWQVRDDAVDRCAGGPIDRLLCQQRARAAACEGLWGQVPECPSGRVADYGN